MIIGVDLDNTSGDYTDALRQYVGEAEGIPVEERLTVFPEPSDYNFTTWPFVSTDFLRYHSEAVAQGIYGKMKVYDGCSQTLWKLDEDGHHIRVITSRFTVWGQNNRVVASTGAWLDKVDLPYRDIMFVRDKGDVYADVYIEDNPSNIFALRALGRTVIVYDALYNRDISGLRAHNWEEVYKLITELAKQNIIRA